MNIKTLIGIIIIVVVVIGGGYILSQNNAPQIAEGPVKIGVIAPLTGDTAVVGEPMRNAIQIATDEINAAGGINGNPIELVIEDGKCDGAPAASAMQKLANVDQVEVVIGGACSGESLAAEPVATAAKVALFSAASSNPKLTDISPYFVRNYPSDSFQGKVLADIANAQGYKKVAVLQEQTDYALGLFQTFDEALKTSGGATAKEEFLTETTDFRTSIVKLRAENPDALFLSVQSSTSGARVLKQLQELGWRPQLFLSDTIMGDPAIVSEYASVLEGGIGAEVGVDANNPKLKALIAAYVAKHGAEPAFQTYAQAAYDAVYIVKNAVETVGYDGTAIANYLHTRVKNYQGASGLITIGANGDPTVGHRPEVITGGKVLPYTR